MFQHPQQISNITLRDIDNYQEKKNCSVVFNYYEGQKSPFCVFIPTENEISK